MSHILLLIMYFNIDAGISWYVIFPASRVYCLTGEPVVSVLVAEDRRSELRGADPDDPSMSSSSAHLHSGSTHETRRLRTVSRIQGDSARKSQ